MAGLIDVDAVKSDTVDLVSECIGFWVGTAGNIAVVTSEGDDITIYGAVRQVVIPRGVIRVKSTGTTATQITGQPAPRKDRNS